MPTRFTTSAQTTMVKELHDLSAADVVDYIRETELHVPPLSSTYVYMTSAAGGDPFICPDCDYKTTVNELLLYHRQRHQQMPRQQ